MFVKCVCVCGVVAVFVLVVCFHFDLFFIFIFVPFATANIFFLLFLFKPTKRNSRVIIPQPTPAWLHIEVVNIARQRSSKWRRLFGKFKFLLLFSIWLRDVFRSQFGQPLYPRYCETFYLPACFALLFALPTFLSPFSIFEFPAQRFPFYFCAACDVYLFISSGFRTAYYWKEKMS